MDNHALPVKFSQRAVSWLIISLLVWQPVAPAFAAAITPNGAARMDKAANGVPVVNIAPPNAAGISHNQFKDYNVGKEGLILNNATGQLNHTQLGGIIQNNPNLKAGREAKGIINEVTGGSRSRLEGYTEVAGKAANVMVANPYGITCSGCGFINTPQATLTTGKPQFDSKGNLMALDVTQGSITVEGKGLDASNSDALSLISRATEVNAAIHAKDLTVTAGANRVAADGSVTAINGTGPAPTVAVDTGALGGMYANRIHLVSSDKGVGVNLGNLTARQGDITLDASGKLVLNNTLASGALTAKADDVQLRGEHKTGAALNVASRGDVGLQNATLASDGKLTLSGKGSATLAGSSLTSGDTLALAGQQLTLDKNSRADGARDVTLKADALTQQGTLLAGGDATLDAARSDNSGMVAARGQLIATGEALTNRGTLQGQDLTLRNTATDNSGTLAADRTLKVNTGSLTTGADSVLTSKGDIALNAGQNADLDGRLNAGSMLSATADTLRTRNTAQLQSEGDLTLSGNALRLDGTQASKGTLSAKADTLTHGGKSNAAAMKLEATTLVNTGTVVADTLDATADDVNNSGLLLANGTQTLNAGTLTNSGTQGAQTLNLTADTINNSGTLQGTGQFTATGQTFSNGASGKLLSAGTLSLNADTLENLGLIQGQDTSLTASTLKTGAGSYTLSGGALTLDAEQLTTLGTLQGQTAAVTANGWTHGGSLLGLDALDASVNGTLDNTGDLLSQGAMAFYAQTLNNGGKMVSVGDVTLDGAQLTNRGSIQGDTLNLHQNSIRNEGTLTGVQALTLGATPRLAGRALMAMALATPTKELINGENGSLLTRGTLDIRGDAVTNNGLWQGQTILLNARSLTNGGTVQSAGDLQFTLTDSLTGSVGSVVTAQGSAALHALALTNQGAWTAKNLTLSGDTLNNSGAVSGVNGLTVTLNDAFTQQKNGTLLSGGALNLNAASVTSAGKLQGAGVDITTGTLTNSGRVQGDSGATLTVRGTLANNAGGEIVSSTGLTVTAPALMNYGLIQGGGDTRLDATTQARNDGRLLSGAKMTLTTPQYIGSGWLQATTLILNAANATNSGTVVADQGTLTGDTFTNQGTTQGGTLGVNYRQLTNGGTLLGNNQLTVNASQVNNLAKGAMFSGGDLWLGSTSFDALGQMVALGNLTLKLTNAFTAKSALAAGKTLIITSNGAIDNKSVLQGETVNLSAGGQLTNNGKITTGRGSSTLSGSGIELNSAGSIQGGGDIALSSRSNITVNGFTGTYGSLTLTAPGAIANTVLMYAANNLALYANSITNQRGDMLAGNNLIMQKDAAGNANKEVINTSGTIETQKGDITIKTGHLLNQREGLSQTRSYHPATDSPAKSGATSIQVKVTSLPADQWGYNYKVINSAGGGNATSSVAPYGKGATQKFLVGTTIVDVVAQGDASQIVANNNLTIKADELKNIASNILAGNNINISGSQLNNESHFGYAEDEYKIYKYSGKLAQVSSLNGAAASKNNPNKKVTYNLAGAPQYEIRDTGQVFRSVIQAGSNVTASFVSDISNTTTTSHSGGVSGTISAPALSPLSNQNVAAGVKKQGLTSAGTVAVNSPQWNDSVRDALEQLNGGGTLDNVANGALVRHQGKTVDTSAYPLPTSQNGYFVTDTNPKSPYLITVNPKLNDLGQLDPALFGDLNKLLGIRPGAARQETRSTYTDEKQFLGSSYMLDRLKLNPEYDYRFLGDAAFDTRYVSNVVLNQTGNRYLNGVGSELEQMRYLMDNAAAAQSSLGLDFGVSLDAKQIASLDHSILWWESATINGETVMVPKVYLSPKDVSVNNGSVIAGNNVSLSGGNITNNGSTLLAKNALTLDSQNSISNLSDGLMKSGSGLNLNAIGDINNVGSTISGKTVALESLTGNISNITQAEQFAVDARGKHGSVSLKDTVLGSTASISATDKLSLAAGKDITLTGATLASGGDVLMNAWGDIALNANQINDAYSQSGFRHVDSTSRYSISQQGSTITAGGNLTMQAGRDINSQAAGLAAEKDVKLQAGRDVNLLAEETASGNSKKAKKKTTINDRVRQQGTEIASGGDTILLAGRDVVTQAAQIVASGDAGVSAGRDITLDTATESDYHYEESKKTKKGFLSKKTTHKISEQSNTREAGTLISGDNVTLNAGQDLKLVGASVVGDGNVALNGDNSVTLEAATNTDSSWQFKETKKSGLMGSGGIGFSIGSSKTVHDLRERGTTQSQSFSTVGSTAGNVSVTSGGQTRIAGADVIAGKDLTVKGDNVVIEPGHDKRTRDEKFEQKTSGLTLALSGSVGSVVNGAVTAAQAAHEESDSRLASLKATQAALSGIQAGLQQQLSAAQGASAADTAFQIAVSLGAQSSKSKTHEESDTVTGSRLTVGDNLAITATGKGNAANSGDITVVGSQLKAGKDVTLDAARDINLISGQNTNLVTGSNSSHGGSVGVALGFGGTTNGLSVSANANASSGKQKGNSLTHSNTTVDAGNTVTLVSDRDTALAGAQVNGSQVTADVGRSLTIASQQDIDNYTSKQGSVSGGLSYTFGGGGPGGSFSFSRDKMDSKYRSVNDQSGLFAGAGGFDVTVGEHTQLDGAVLASTATADKNRLDTGTLGFGDIYNEADFRVQHQGGGFSTGGIGALIASNIGNVMLMGAGSNGHSDGTTQAAISQGTIVVRDQDRQKQDIADLSRDAQNANDSISKIFDKEKEQRRMEQAQLIGEISSQVGKIVSTYGEIAATESANEKMKGVQQEDRESARKAWEERNPNKTATEQDVSQYLYDGFYNSALEKSEMGTGGSYQRAIQATTAIVQGLSGGNINAALAGAAAPYLANQIAQHIAKEDKEARLIAHAVLGAALAAVQKQDIAAGAAGASIGELAGMIALELKGVTAGELSEADKQTVSALATLASTLAGGLIGDNGATAVNAGLAGKNAVENNALSSTQALTFDKELSDCRKSGGDCQAIIDKWKAISDKQSAETDQKLKDNPLEAQVIDKEVAQGGVGMTERPGWMGNLGLAVMTSEEAKAYVQKWNGQDLANIDVNSPGWTKFAAFASDPENQAALASMGMLGKNIVQLAKNFAKGYIPSKGLPVPAGLSKDIHSGQQGKHIPGHNNYTPGRSPLLDGIDPQKLLNGVHSGEYKIIRMTPRNQPVVNFVKPIGNYEGQPTNYGIVHYGKNGAHIVPANPVQH